MWGGCYSFTWIEPDPLEKSSRLFCVNCKQISVIPSLYAETLKMDLWLYYITWNELAADQPSPRVIAHSTRWQSRSVASQICSSCWNLQGWNLDMCTYFLQPLWFWLMLLDQMLQEAMQLSLQYWTLPRSSLLLREVLYWSRLKWSTPKDVIKEGAITYLVQ